MPEVLNIWRDSSRRAKGVFLGCLGIASLLFTFAPVWDTTAGAEIGPADYTPKTGPAGTTITFTGLTGCLDTPLPTDVLIEINTESTFFNGRDFMHVPFEEDGTYTIQAPPEYGFQAGLDVGPSYDVGIGCVTEEDLNQQGEAETLSIRVFQDGYTYPRATTTSTTAATTSSTAATTSTTAATTSTTGATTSTTGATTSTTGATTSTTGATSTTATTVPATTTTAASSTTHVTSTTFPPPTTSTTSSTIPGPNPTLPSSTTSTTSGTIPGPNPTLPSSTTTSTSSTVPASPSSTEPPSSTQAPPTAPPSSAAPACTASDTTPNIGQALVVSCGGLAPGSTVTVDLFSDPVRLATLTASSTGTVSGSVRIPLGTPAGSHEVRFTGTAPDGSALVRSVPVTVTRELPRTGDETWTLFRVGLLLLGAGLLATGRAQVVRATG